MLEILTFTGVDAKTPMDSLRKIAEKYPRVEFGVLLGDRTGGEAPIFPPMDTVNELKAKGRQMGFKTSIHLCGIFARETLKSLENGSGFLSDLVDGFDRVQINLHPDSFTPGITRNQLLSGVKRISQFAESITPDRVILQQRAGWARRPNNPRENRVPLRPLRGRWDRRNRRMAQALTKVAADGIRRRHRTRHHQKSHGFRGQAQRRPTVAGHGGKNPDARGIPGPGRGGGRLRSRISQKRVRHTQVHSSREG